ncbi:calmodulin-like protein 4 [Mercenaria mercenaria]|uniref:calmodulin-like protein 4 n=1 Tax=Mercenaria mercenaria TaxID=6596 RepID=UPI001E1D2934|nr:calmodulin-like protein 4 [Mercenaria mercenaria]
MAKFFSQNDIDLFKECFFFIAKRGYTTSEQEMGTIMRSLSYSPTEEEIHNYFQKYVKDGKIDFASFLEVMHEHNTKENAIREITNAFRAHDKEGRGYVQTNEVKNVLLNLGEGLTRREVEALFRDGGVSGGQIRYSDFIDNIAQPVPDY